MFKEKKTTMEIWILRWLALKRTITATPNGFKN